VMSAERQRREASSLIHRALMKNDRLERLLAPFTRHFRNITAACEAAIEGVFVLLPIRKQRADKISNSRSLDPSRASSSRTVKHCRRNSFDVRMASDVAKLFLSGETGLLLC
jgi:hypothetical protein